MSTERTFVKSYLDMLGIEGFTAMHVLLYGQIVSLSVRRGYCYANNKKLAEDLHCSPRHISDLLSRLVQQNHITLELTPQGRHIYPIGITYKGEQPTTPTPKVNKKKVLSKAEHAYMTTILEKWNNAGGSKHVLADNGKEQKPTMIKINRNVNIVKQGVVAFYKHYSSEWDVGWLKKNNISESTIKNSPLKFTDARQLHMALIRETKQIQADKRKLPTYDKNKTEYIVLENNFQASPSLLDFFVTTSQVSKKKKSWLLYWICKYTHAQIRQEKEETILKSPQYNPTTYMDGKFRKLYSRLPKEMFKHNKKTSIKDTNKVTAYIDTIVTLLSPYYQSELPKELNLKGVSIGAFVDHMILYFRTDAWEDLRTKIDQTDIAYCHIKGKNWDNMLLKIANDSLVKDRWKKNYHLIKSNNT